MKAVLTGLNSDHKAKSQYNIYYSSYSKPLAKVVSRTRIF